MLVTKTDDGFTAEVPSLTECETWAPSEDEVVDKIVELARYYLKLRSSQPLHADKIYDNFIQKKYKLVFTK